MSGFDEMLASQLVSEVAELGAIMRAIEAERAKREERAISALERIAAALEEVESKLP